MPSMYVLNNVSEVKSKSADTGDKDCGYNEEVLVVAKVNALEHLKTAYCDESVKSHADTTHYT